MSAITATIQLRRDTAANWTTNNPTLLAGEVGFETDTKRAKLGDGATAWTSLAYIDPSWLIDNSVTNAKLANMAEATIKGRQAGSGTGDPEDLSASQARMAMGLASGALIDVTPSYISYTGGNQANSTLNFADVHSSAGWSSLAPGMYMGEFYISHNAAATTTGARFGLNGTVTQDYLTALISYSTQAGDRSTAQTASFDAGTPAPSSLGTTGNVAILQFTINVTATGNLVLRFASEVNASAITVTAVLGFIRRVS